MKDYLPFTPLITGMAVEAYFLPWLFVAQIVFFAAFAVITTNKRERNV